MSSSSALEEMHHIEPHVQVARARAGVLLLILSDALSIVAILAAGGYLNTLNVLGQFKGPDHPPAFLPGLLLAIVLALSGLAYFGWERSISRGGASGQRVFFFVSLLLLLVALVGQIWVSATLGYGAPFHAFASLILLLYWYSAFHLLLAAIVGLLLMGRIFTGRLEGYAYIPRVTGYWWYYTVIAGVVMWLFVLAIA